MHPSTIDRLELDGTPVGRFGDLLGDGSRVLAYRSSALGASSLHVLQWKDLKVRRLASFSEGRFDRLGGDLVVISRSRPLGRYVSLGCEGYGTTSQDAFRTTLYAWRQGRFSPVDGEHPVYFEEELARKEERLASLRESLGENAGVYAGLALSLYFDHVALGRRREGWKRLSELLQPPAYAPRGLKRCFKDVAARLRVPLDIPDDWR